MFTISGFYKFKKINSLKKYKTYLENEISNTSIKGLMIISSEGINGTLAGKDKDIYKIYPTSVPLTADLTRTGYTKVVQKVVGPDWRPTEAMRKRDPQLPKYMPPGPDNPLGTHALYLSWSNYRIHGTSDTRKIGRQSSSGCIGLYNEHIEELFNFVKIGMQVRLI